MKAFEDATGKPLDEDKKELASEELITCWRTPFQDTESQPHLWMHII